LWAEFARHIGSEALKKAQSKVVDGAIIFHGDEWGG